MSTLTYSIEKVGERAREPGPQAAIGVAGTL